MVKNGMKNYSLKPSTTPLSRQEKRVQFLVKGKERRKNVGRENGRKIRYN